MAAPADTFVLLAEGPAAPAQDRHRAGPNEFLLRDGIGRKALKDEFDAIQHLPGTVRGDGDLRKDVAGTVRHHGHRGILHRDGQRQGEQQGKDHLEEISSSSLPFHNGPHARSRCA